MEASHDHRREITQSSILSHPSQAKASQALAKTKPSWAKTL